MRRHAWPARIITTNSLFSRRCKFSYMKHPGTRLHNPPGLQPDQMFERLRGQIRSPRWRGLDSYDLTRTDKGWITHRRGPIDNQAGPDGSPAWYGELSNDSIVWVDGTPGFIHMVWEGLTSGELTHAKAQEAFTRYCGYLTSVNALHSWEFQHDPKDWDEHDWERLKGRYPNPRQLP